LPFFLLDIGLFESENSWKKAKKNETVLHMKVQSIMNMMKLREGERMQSNDSKRKKIVIRG
jgi:hypothetical protein